jgi:hypothetical protein
VASGSISDIHYVHTHVYVVDFSVSKWLTHGVQQANHSKINVTK